MFNFVIAHPNRKNVRKISRNALSFSNRFYFVAASAGRSFISCLSFRFRVLVACNLMEHELSFAVDTKCIRYASALYYPARVVRLGHRNGEIKENRLAFNEMADCRRTPMK